MTSMKRISNVKTSRRNNADQDREQFERSQEASFRKGISDEEIPVKMKHVRTLIIGTHTDKSGLVFWRLVSLAPPLNTDVTSWKFCHCVHLILRDGHVNFIRDSVNQIGRIKTLGDHFMHLPVGYGELVKNYCDLLVCKLTFHQHYPRFPGHLQVTPEELSSIAENDANNYFQMAVEMLDYMEKILNLYATVFKSLNPSRSNSMTKMGQCRLSSLIPCIQDSSCLYDLCVRILFQLHKAVPVDMLSGHRKRFNSQFKLLLQFYNGTRNLQYFKMLVQVPHLPQNPPNFLVEAELGSHVAPVVVLEAEQPEPIETVDSLLVDAAGSDPPPIPPHPHPDAINSHNGSLMDVLAEKESLIDALQEEITSLRNDIQKDRSTSSFKEERLSHKISDLQSLIAELESELFSERQNKEAVLEQVEAAAVSAEALTKLSEEKNRRRTAEEKFSKMKEVYQKLREEHISLIRAKSELEKELCNEKEKFKQEKELREEHEQNQKKADEQLANHEEIQKSYYDCLKEKKQLEIRFQDKCEECCDTDKSKEAIQKELSEFKDKIAEEMREHEQEILEAEKTLESSICNCVSSSVNSAVEIINHSLAQFENSAHLDMKSSADFTLVYQQKLDSAVNCLVKEYSKYKEEPRQGTGMPSKIEEFSHFLAVFLLHAKASSHASPDLEVANDLVANLDNLGKSGIEALKSIKDGRILNTFQADFLQIFEKCCSLVSNCTDRLASKDDLASIVQSEMDAMDKAINKAVQKFTTLLDESRAKDTGTQLEVNEGILGTCGDLMAAVRLLVQRASDLQKQIVASGMGRASPREYYKRNHRWTEGLISGAKAVAIACQALLVAADQVANGKGKFEEVIVASREIAASSMQLVMASRVNAHKSSEQLDRLNEAAKTISSLTGTVVATAESCINKMFEATVLDFSNLSLHSTKRLEMETMVKMLETEKQLETERNKLAQLRKHHYKLAGELDGLN